MSDKLLIVDGNSILNRAFYAIKGPRMLTKADGTPTNAVFGFLNILNKYLEEENLIILQLLLILKVKPFVTICMKDTRPTEKGCPMSLQLNCPLSKMF